MAGGAALFRLTNSGDTEASVGSGEKIEFNTGAVPDSTGRVIHTGFRAVRDLNFHPNPRRALDQIQDSLLGTLEITLTGYFIEHDTTIGPKNLFDWQKDPTRTTDFPFGRFGLRQDDFAANLLDLVPTASIGYMLNIVEVNDVETPRDEASFIVKLYRNGSI